MLLALACWPRFGVAPPQAATRKAMAGAVTRERVVRRVITGKWRSNRGEAAAFMERSMNEARMHRLVGSAAPDDRDQDRNAACRHRRADARRAGLSEAGRAVQGHHHPDPERTGV